ncbi:MAG: hypothetical protein PHV37_05470 [Candidatus Gastranaerophilales bacterium]|nr:hypothetical protein [Candidatus Gastranaerophilales bacterium]
MKKLLILGANPETVSLINLAKQMGVYTIVTDYDPNAYAKPFADKSYDVDGLDIDGLVNLAKNEQIDGVLVGTADPLISAYQKVCEILQLPCYANENSVKALTNKYFFKNECKKFNILGIPEFSLDKSLKPTDIKNLKFPLFIKPADSNSGKGMTICYSVSELEQAVEKALYFSPSKKFLVERYMTCDDMFLYYTFKDGECYLSATADKYVCKEQGELSPVCLGCTYPSKYTDLYLNTAHSNFVKMFKALDIKNGILMITAFVENNTLYVYDPGFRLQGEAPNLLLASINGYDQRKMLINFALGNSFVDNNMDKLGNFNFDGKFASTVWLLLKEGEIASIEGLEKIKASSEVVNIVQRFDVGDVVKKEFIGTEKQVFARLYVVCNSKDEFKQFDSIIQKTIKIFDVNGNNMLLKGFDYEAL